MRKFRTYALSGLDNDEPNQTYHPIGETVDSRGKCHIRWNAKTDEEEEGGGGLRREKPAPAVSEKQLPSPADGERVREAALAPSARRRRGAAPARQVQGAARVRDRSPTGHCNCK